MSPRLGILEANLERHHEILAEARAGGAGLVVFPELGLTGYQLQDLASEVAMYADDARLTGLASKTKGMSAVVSFVEEAADHRLFISAALLEDGAVRFIHRKLFLPTYGLFDERRFFAAGDKLRAVDSRLGVRLGIAVCEDFWHLAVPETLTLDGAQVLINVSSSPGRDLAAIHEIGLGTAASWRALMRTWAGAGWGQKAVDQLAVLSPRPPARFSARSLRISSASSLVKSCPSWKMNRPAAA